MVLTLSLGSEWASGSTGGPKKTKEQSSEQGVA